MTRKTPPPPPPRPTATPKDGCSLSSAGVVERWRPHPAGVVGRWLPHPGGVVERWPPHPAGVVERWPPHPAGVIGRWPPHPAGVLTRQTPSRLWTPASLEDGRRPAPAGVRRRFERLVDLEDGVHHAGVVHLFHVISERREVRDETCVRVLCKVKVEPVTQDVFSLILLGKSRTKKGIQSESAQETRQNPRWRLLSAQPDFRSIDKARLNPSKCSCFTLNGG